MNISKVVCFSGYRPEKFPFPLIKSCPEFATLHASIRAAIIQAMEDGYTSFLCGMAQGFDLLCAEAVMGLQNAGGVWGEIQLVAVLPFAGHSVSVSWRAAHSLTLEQASRVVTIAPAYQAGVYFQRNRYLVDHASRLICYYDGQPGGTEYTLRYARKMRREIINVATSE